MFETKSATKYSELSQEHFSTKGSIDLDEGPSQPKRRSLQKLNSLPLYLLFLSVFINGFFLSRQLYLSKPNCDEEPSLYAGLKRNVPLAFYEDQLFNSRNITVQDAIWDDWESGVGVIAVSDEYVKEKGLPPAQRWPWDKSKSLYFTHAHHNLHCLKVIRSAIMDNFHKRPQRQPFVHLFHCLDAFHQDIICNADDTPRYTGKTNHVSSGLGQVKMCRDWNQLELWSKENSACYKNIDPFNESIPIVERYKFCPYGDKPWEKLTEQELKEHDKTSGNEPPSPESM